MKLILFIIFILSFEAYANICKQALCPQGRQAQRVCFYDSRKYEDNGIKVLNHFIPVGQIGRKEVEAECKGYDHSFVADSVEEVAAELDKLASECKTVSELRFSGHGQIGYQDAGDLDIDNIKSLKKYSCLFEKESKIEFLGCHVSQDCEGEYFLFQTAKTLLKEGGSVSAPFTYRFPLPQTLYRGMPSFNKKILYTPSDIEKYKLSYDVTYASSDLMKSIAQKISKRVNDSLPALNLNNTCAQEFPKLIAQYQKNLKRAQNKNCFLPVVMSDQRLQSYRQLGLLIASRADYIEKATGDEWEEVKTGLTILKTHIEGLENCSAGSSY